jgi:hypothetical protein
MRDLEGVFPSARGKSGEWVLREKNGFSVLVVKNKKSDPRPFISEGSSEQYVRARFSTKITCFMH